MRKLIVLAISAAMLFVTSPAIEANAAVVKTTITITPPSFVFAGVSNPVDVAVCPKTSLSATQCYMDGPERSVTLWANGQKVQTLQTVGGGGAATFNWTPRSAGSTTLKVTVAARSGWKALTSETKKVTVKAKTKASSLGTIACGTVCVQGIPNRLDLNIEEVITAGIASGVVKGRKIRFQTLRVTNKYEDQISANSTWQSDINRYGIALSFSDIDQFSDCTPGETLTWNFRFYADATSKSPAAATAAKWIDLICPVGDGNTGQIEMTVDYSDQDMDYSSYYPEPIPVSITAPDSAQYSIYSVYCSDSDDCSDEANWYTMDGFTKADNVFGSRDFNLDADPGDYGTYWVKIEVIPWTDQDIFYSDWYKIDLW
jgi:hypothetical protein